MAASPENWYKEERAALQPRRSDAPVLEAWMRVLATLRKQIEEAVPGPEVIMLYALEASGREKTLTEEDRQRLDAEREAIEAALARYEGLRAVVDEIITSCEDFEAAWSEEAQPLSTAPDRTPAARARSRTRLFRQVGSALAAVVLLAALFFLLRGDAGVVVTETAPDEIVRLELVDGSTVRLMGESRLVHAAEEAFDRRVELEGRAFFDVRASDAAFVVTTPTARATVTGTNFGVEADETTTEVVLATGRLVLASADVGEEVSLSPGERSIVARGEAPTPPERVDLAEHLAWTGLLIFRETPVREIAQRLAQIYNVTVTVAPVLEEEPISGTFERAQPVEEILGALAATLGADVERVNSTFRLVPSAD